MTQDWRDLPKFFASRTPRHYVAIYSPRGSKHGFAKLTEEQVAEIHKLLFEGHSLSSIGRRFGVTYVTVLYIRDGRTWQHVPPYTPAAC